MACHSERPVELGLAQLLFAQLKVHLAEPGVGQNSFAGVVVQAHFPEAPARGVMVLVVVHGQRLVFEKVPVDG